MVEEALSLGRKYVGISDHAPEVEAHGLATAKREILARKREVEKLRRKFGGRIEIFFGAEVNVDSTGEMALPDELLSLYEYTIGAIHTSFDQPKELTTKRLLTVLENPYVNLLAHPTGRLLGERDAYELDWEKLFSVAQKP